MNAVPLRAVMDASEYKLERQHLQETFGDPDDKSEMLVAKRDQAFSELFYRSGWTQEQLAELEEKSQDWVSKRLRLGRFIAYGTNKAAALFVSLTEWKFRGYWERTDKNDNESVRFDAVIRLMQAPSEPAGEPRKRQSPKTDEAREIVRPLVESGKPVNPVTLAKEHGLTERAVANARMIELGRLEGLQEAVESGPIDTSVLSKTAQDKFKTLERRLRAQLEADHSRRVQLEVTRHIEEYLMPHYKEKLEKAELLTKIGRPLTKEQFYSLLGAVHPDTTNAVNRNAAFILLKAREVVLRPDERDKPLSGDLPTTLAELMARKKSRAKSAFGKGRVIENGANAYDARHD